MQLSMAKNSSDAGLSDIVHDVAENGIASLKENVSEFGLFAAMDMVKGASTDNKISDQVKQAAIHKIVNDPIIQDSVALQVAAEYFDMGPTICKNASYISDDDALALIDFQREVYSEISNPNVHEKKAASALAMGLINRELNDAQQGQEGEDSEGLQLGNSQDSSNLISEEEEDINKIDGVHVDPSDEHAEEFLEKYRDIIDAAFDVK